MSKRRFSSFLCNFSMHNKKQSPSLIILLPDDLIIDVLARVSKRDYPTLSLVSKHFHSLVFSLELYARRSTKEKEETQKKEFECSFSTKEAKERNWGNNCETIFVNGFDSSLHRDYIKIALGKHFGSCGQVIRVSVPIECKTGARLGFAFINLEKDGEKALTLNGSDLGGRKLEVMMAKDRDGSLYPFPNFEGCKICRIRLYLSLLRLFKETHSGHLAQRGGPEKETWLNPFFKREPQKCWGW